MKTLKIIGNLASIVATGMLVASFFMEDNKKAVRTRWGAVALGVAGGITRVIASKETKTSK